MFRRRRPLMRAAVVGGGAYVAGKKVAQRSAEQGQQEDEQDERLATLEDQASATSDPPAQDAPAAAPSMPDQLKQLAALHEQGALTDDEFATAKARLLGSQARAAADPRSRVPGSLEGAQDEQAVQGNDQRRYPGLGARLGAGRAAQGSRRV